MADQLSTDLASLRIDRTAPAKGGGGAFRWILILATVGALGFAAYAYAWPLLEARVFKTPVELTEVVEVSPAQASVELTATGYVIAQRVSKLASKVPGKVLKIYVKQGDKVKAGDVVYEIDPLNQNALIATSDSQAAAARARAAVARANLEEAQQQRDREQRLANEGINPKNTAMDRALRVAALAEGVKAADAESKAAAAQAQALRINLTDYKVRAPISGVVTNKPPQEGEFVGPQPAGIAADMGGVEVADFSSLMAEVDVPEARLGLLKPEAPAEIILDAFPMRRMRGKLAEITPKLNRSKATVTVKVAFVDEKTGVLPEMAARVSFLTEALDASAMKAPPKRIVPSVAVAERNGTKVVFIYDGGKLRMAPIEVGPAFGSGFELTKGPTPGTKLIKSPSPDLFDGQRVKEKSEG